MVLVSWNGTDLDLTFSDHSKVYGQEQLEARSKDGMLLGWMDEPAMDNQLFEKICFGKELWIRVRGMG